MASEVVATPPSISVNLTIDPPRFAVGTTTSNPTITLTATLHASQAITIFTWPGVFNLKLSQRRKNFTCHDLTSDLPFFVELTKGPRRSGFSRRRGCNDDAYFHTLEPETSVTFSASFALAHREGRYAVTAGHRYSYGISDGEVVRWWRYGRKDNVMAPPDQPAGLGKADGESIILEHSDPVIFEVEEGEIIALEQ